MSSSPSEIEGLLEDFQAQLREGNTDRAESLLDEIRTRLLERQAAGERRAAALTAIRDAENLSRENARSVLTLTNTLHKSNLARARLLTQAAVFFTEGSDAEGAALTESAGRVQSLEAERDQAIEQSSGLVEESEIPPRLVIRPLELPESDVSVDDPVPIEPTIENVGDSPATDVQVQIREREGLTFGQTSFSTDSIPAGASTMFETRVTAGSDGSFTLSIRSTAANTVTAEQSGTLVVRGEPLTESERRSVMITANGPASYALTVDGSIEPDTYGGNFSAEDSDSVTENDDGTVTAADETGPLPDRASATSYIGDRYRFTGSVTKLTITADGADPDVTLYLDEADVPESELRGFEDTSGETHTLMITANAPVRYTLTVNGTLEPDTVGGQFSSEESDSPSRNGDGTFTVSDETGPAPENASPTTYFGDRFLIEGRITQLDVPTGDSPPDVNVYLNEALTPLDDILDS